MGTMTLADFRAQLVIELLGRTDAAVSGTAGEARLDRAINWAYFHVSHPRVAKHREVQRRYNFTLVLDQTEYAIDETTLEFKAISPRGFYYIEAASFDYTSNRNKLTKRVSDEIEKSSHTSQARPARYSIEGEVVRFTPPPNSSAAGNIVTSLWWGQPTELSATTDVTVLPYTWDEIIVLGSVWRMQRQLGYHAEAELTKADFVAMINEIQGFTDEDDVGSSSPGIDRGPNAGVMM